MKQLFLLIFATLMVAVSHAATFFPSRTDFRDEQIYFVMTTRFYNGDPNNDTQCWDAQNYNVGDPAWRGDFKGLIEKLDYIKALGFTAIWITPVVENASGYDYHGYHARNFSKVDERYESEDVKFKDLIDAAHAKGMKIILDIVLNHTGNFGEENLCKLFTRDWNADQSDVETCMIPFTQKDGGMLPDNYNNLPGGEQYNKRLAMMKNTDGTNHDKNNYWHHYGNFNWDDDTRWWAQIAGDCVDLNTENAYVANYLIKCYGTFIAMGVDGFRIDTGGHISRLSFNKNFIPQFRALAEQHKAARNGGDFFMFAEVCSRDRNVTYRGQDRLSPYFYTWTEKKNYTWDNSETSWNNVVVMEGAKGNHANVTAVDQHAADYVGQYSDGRTSQNALLNGNTYHAPDYSQYSGLSVIDFPMHWNFRSASEAWGVKSNDNRYNDATWNVTYVDSHDYAPDGAPEGTRFDQDQSTWAENLSLMFTFRGIPCVYYGSEIEFKKGCVIDKGPNIALRETGRAYFGGYIKGDIKVTDFAEYSNATGNIAQTLKHPLSLHIQRLAKIRMAVPALRKGQYSTSGCSGSFAFKRRYTDATTDSYALITISGGATFSSIPNGTYVDCVTGDIKTVTNGSLSVSCSGKGNLRVYVLNTDLTKAPGKIGADGKYIYASSSVAGSNPNWDGTQEELDDRFGEGGSSDWGETVEPCLEAATERVVFFQAEKDFGTSAAVHIWNSTGDLTGGWPGQRATHLGGGTFKFVIPENITGDGSDWQIIWNNNGNGKQTSDLRFTMRGLYNISGYQRLVTTLCEGGDSGEEPSPNPEPNPHPDPDPETSDICLNAANERVVFFQAEQNFGTSAKVYMWIKGTDTNLLGTWPGTAAVHLGNGKFKFELPDNLTGDESQWMIIWNNGNGTQTADFKFVMRGLYTMNGYQGLVTALCEGGDTGEEPTPNPNPETPGITIKAKVPAHWTSTITAWVWEDGADGIAVTPTKQDDWYVYTHNGEKINIIFRNGTDWNGSANQTEDMTFTQSSCIQLIQSGDRKATYTLVNCDVHTDIEQIPYNESLPCKVLINGALYLLMPNGNIYDASGRMIQ